MINRYEKFKTEDLPKICELYSSGLFVREIARIFNYNEDTVLRNMKKSGIEIQKGSYRRFSSEVNEKLFTDESEERSYFYGFILADGNINDSGKVSITVNSKDKEILEKFIDKAKLKSSVRSRERFDQRTGKSYQSSSVAFTNKALVSGLVNLGLRPRKSTKETVPHEMKFDKHFWRGLIDGDGSVSNRNGKYPILNLCGSKEVCECFIEFCNECVLETEPYLRQVKDNFYSVTYNGKKSLPLIKYIYEDSKIYLSRKKNIAEEILNAFSR